MQSADPNKACSVGSETEQTDEDRASCAGVHPRSGVEKHIRPSATTCLTITIAAILFLSGIVGSEIWYMMPSPPLGPLKDIVEPITFADLGSYDDGGSQVLWIRDAKGRIYSVCWMNRLDGHQELLLGEYGPTRDETVLRQFPLGGRSDRAFLGLLERWSEYDPEFDSLEQRYRKLMQKQIDADAYWDEAYSGSRAKVVALHLLHELQERCRTPGTAIRD